MNILQKGILTASITLMGSVAFAGGAVSSSDSNTTFDRLHQSGAAVQLGTEFIGLAYYASNHKFTVGAELNPITSSKVDGSTSNTSPVSALVFSRYNMPLTSHVVVGFGAMYGREFGNKSSNKEFITTVAAPYIALEYSATPHILLAASFRPVTYVKEEDGTTGIKTTTWSYINGGSVQIAYRF